MKLEHSDLSTSVMDLLIFSATSIVTVFYWKKSQRLGAAKFTPKSKEDAALLDALQAGTSLNANELISLVDENNVPVEGGALRKDMRLYNLWHRATYVLIIHTNDEVDQVNPKNLHQTFVFVQRRSAAKDYYPQMLDPVPGGVVEYKESYRDNAIRELKEEMGIDIQKGGKNTIKRQFVFPYENERVKVWGEFYECYYRGREEDLIIQKEEVESVTRMSLLELMDRVKKTPEDFMPDACHAIKLYFQRLCDLQVQRRILKGYSSENLDAYKLRPKPKVVFFDCDDCLYFDGWKTANMITKRIDDWCTNRHGLKHGEAYQLYKKYGTALRGLLAEKYIENSDKAIDEFLEYCHDLPIRDLLKPDKELREMILRMDPSIPRYIFTASVDHHAIRCIEALGIDDLFVGVIDCKKCDLETKHSKHAFETAMRIAGVDDPEECVFFDDNVRNISAATEMGWRSVLVGRLCRDQGKVVTSEHAELEVDKIHHIERVMPELFQQIFPQSESM